MNQFPPADPVVCTPEQFVSLYARATIYAVAILLNLIYIYLGVRMGFKRVSSLLITILLLLFSTNLAAAMIQYFNQGYQTLKC